VTFVLKNDIYLIFDHLFLKIYIVKLYFVLYVFLVYQFKNNLNNRIFKK